MRIILVDERPAEPLRAELFYEGGVKEFVKYLDRHKTPMIEAPIFITGERDDIGVEVAMWWNDSYHETVLPFTNMSDDPKQEYFSDGLTDQIIAGLSKVPHLFVIARNSVFTYKGKPVKVQQVAQEGDVDFVVETEIIVLPQVQHDVPTVRAAPATERSVRGGPEPSTRCSTARPAGPSKRASR